MHTLLPTRLGFCWLLGLGIVLHQTSASDVLDIVKVTKDVTRFLVKDSDFVNQNLDFNQLPIPILRSMEQILFENFERINSKLQHLDERDDYLTMTILYSFPERVRHELGLNHLRDIMSTIDAKFCWMLNYGIKGTSYKTVKMKEFVQRVTWNDASSVVNLMKRMHAFVVPLEANITNLGTFSLLANALQETESNVMCSIRQSPQQVLYNLYYAIALRELKGYTLVQISYLLLRLYGKGKFTSEVQHSREIFEKRTNEVVETVRKAMQNISREVWKCDPKQHEKGETYQEITNFLQGYVENENNLNNQSVCGRDCVEYTFAESNGKHPTCSGKVLDCKFIDANMWICNASESERRYEYIEYENGRVLGRKLGCPRNTTKINSPIYMFWKCSYCFCLCEEQGLQSDRYFNMRAVISDIHNNRVVTGLRFVKKNRVIHLQIEEGELLPRMIVNATTLHWKEPENYYINDRKVFDGQDYHTLTWKNRKMDLDDLEADEGYILTGVRFKEIGTHLNFEIYITKFDFATGKLIPGYSKWKDNSNTDVVDVSKPVRKEVKLDHSDVPTKTTFPSIPTSQSNQYIEFTHSDMDRDAAQTTVPFLDTQEVKSFEAVPLTGAGIFHKGRHFFGGFIAPKIITYNVIKYLPAGLPTEEVN